MCNFALLVSSVEQATATPNPRSARSLLYTQLKLIFHLLVSLVTTSASWGRVVFEFTDSFGLSGFFL